jgi:hypothetical protein
MVVVIELVEDEKAGAAADYEPALMEANGRDRGNMETLAFNVR